MRIHDTLSRTEISIEPDHVGIYVCGATVYDDSHVGHARAAIVFDVLRRHLVCSGADVKFVQNFTDVDDKILERATSTDRNPTELADTYIQRYIEDSESLNILRPTNEPKVTEHIPEIIEMIRKLVKTNSAYVTDNGVYFDVSGFAGYGKLSGKKTDELLEGARVGIDPLKRSPLDFALWKNHEDALSWDSPWGRGRPGWHIECSAMSEKYFAGGVDIHGGGRDLIFPHHENEIAQSESCTNHALAKVWMHVGMVTVDGQKMSKSAGNSKNVRTALGEWGANALRVFCLGAHYAKPIDYSESAMSECATRWQQAETCHYELRHTGAQAAEYTKHPSWKKFTASLDDNCNTRGALDALFELASKVNDAASLGTLTDASFARGAFDAMIDVLGLKVKRTTEKNESMLDELASKRDALRASSEYDRADAVRDEMIAMGADVLDHAKHTVWVIRE